MANASQRAIWFKRFLVVSVTPIVGFGSRFIRNVILSRSLVPDEFGTAIAISVVISLLGLITDVALDRFVIVDRSASSLAAAHLVAALRGIALSLIFVVFGRMVAVVFTVPQYSLSFAAAGVIPLIDGFGHLWIKQIKRDYVYLPEALARLIASVVAIIALTLAVAILKDHRAILFGFVAESAAYVLASHIFARVPYEIRTNRPALHKAVSFGLPLTLNGIGLATITQLDRILVGSLFGVGTLGLYAILLNISVMPTTLLLSSVSVLAMSYLTSEEQAAEPRPEKYRALVALFSMLGNLYSLFVALTLDWLTPLIFGDAFTINETVHLLIVGIVYFRIQRAGAPTALLLVRSQTGRLAFLNLSAGLGLIIALVLVLVWPRFEAVLLGVLAGDIISYAVFCLEKKKRAFTGDGVGITDSAIGGAVLLAIVGALWMEPGITLQARGLVLIVGLSAIGFQCALECYKNVKLRALLFDSQ